MPFLSKLDLYLTILDDELNEITRQDDTIVIASCTAAISEMRTILNDSFDVDAIFNATGTNRHQLLLRLGCDIAVYYIVARCQAGQYLQDRLSRYDRAVNTLKAFAKNETYSDLPRRTATQQTQIVYNSNPKRHNYF